MGEIDPTIDTVLIADAIVLGATRALVGSVVEMFLDKLFSFLFNRITHSVKLNDKQGQPIPGHRLDKVQC